MGWIVDLALVRWAFWACGRAGWESSGEENERPSEVDGEAGEDQVGVVSLEGEVSGAALVVVAFEHGEEGLPDPVIPPIRGDRPVALLRPGRRGVVCLLPRRQMRFLIPLSWRRARRVRVVGLVGPDLLTSPVKRGRGTL